MRRREFLGALAGVAALPFAAAQAQQPDRVRRIGVLNPKTAKSLGLDVPDKPLVAADEVIE